ncbi:uncharacterized protein LOC126340110 [Schistocerca gregaria]|uniref:uncharacterized protein LOC126340110 n=1 Tax=Schistocerca gregaria TaxID=7010 RepID=UPI00211E9414|nr:uncharacterized protein LOC126340110 [Schistocerca gregaria]
MAAPSTALLFLLLAAAATSATAQLAWWQSGVVYQIYPKSFKDSDGDGVGDLNGIIEKLEYLKDLGVAAIWLSPIYKSPMADNGYDIADFREIDPIFGTMEDFDRLLAEAHSRGIKVILDFVPNHTSDEHEWFVASSDPTHENHEIYKDYYVWLDGKDNGSVPNNWKNMFDEGSAWKWSQTREMYYLHQFHEKQPDLDYRNPDVLSAMQGEMKFWLDKGVDGFRMDAVMCLVEAEGFPDAVEGQPTPMQHQDETYVVIQEFRKVMDNYTDTVMMTEAYGTVEQVVGYYGNATNPGAHFSFNFLLITDLNSASTAEDFASVIGNWIDVINTRELWSNWVIGNHDQHRVASRYSPELVDGMNMLVTLLPGTAVTYNGEEIGMEDNCNMTCEVAHDPQGCHDNVTLGNSRDPERTPFQWDNTANAGFSNTTDTTWLPVNENYETLNAAAQEAGDRSHLKTYRQLVQLRADPAVQTGDTKVNSSGNVLAFSRSMNDRASVVVLVNVGTEEETVDLVDTLPIVTEDDVLEVYARSLESQKEEGEVLETREVTLSGQEAVVLRRKQEQNAAASRPLSAAAVLLTIAALLWAGGVNRFCITGPRQQVAIRRFVARYRAREATAPVLTERHAMRMSHLSLVAVLLAVTSPVLCLEWWKTAIIYQIYPKSFKDSDGDGVGDLRGIIEKLDYLRDLGVSAIWMSPIFRSPMADNGYDISDFRDIDPTFGTMADFDELLATAHNKSIRVILDFVPNHSSDEHEWFIASSDPTHENYTKYKDYYVWVNGTYGTPPNNWPGGFNEPSAWEWIETRQQYYLHQFLHKQPDLNYRNPVVLEEMKNVLRFWLDKGVDGFRMDAVSCIVEAEGFPDIVDGQPNPMQHQPETYAVIEEFRTVLDEYQEKVMMTEAYGSLDQVLGYYGNATNPGAHFSFNFLLITDLNGDSSAEDFVRIVGDWINVVNENGVWSNWVIGNHDQHRVASRYSPEMVDGMNMLVTLLPGTAVTYNGEEIGMEDNYNMTCEVAQDPQGCADNVTLGSSRDPQRTPFQWDDTKNAGFSTADVTWLPVNPNYPTLNAALQDSVEGRSHIKTYRLLAQLRQDESLHNSNAAVTSTGNVFLFSRGQTQNDATVVAMNVGSEEATVDIIASLPDVDLPTTFVVYASSVNSELDEGLVVDGHALRLPSEQAVVLRSPSARTGGAVAIIKISVLWTASTSRHSLRDTEKASNRTCANFVAQTHAHTMMMSHLSLIVVVLAVASPALCLEWWKTAIIYQIYPKSFKDSDGDGVGDLRGIIEKLDYLNDLGVSAIWISPIFRSPMADNGYDISDYRDIDPIFGTMDDFDELLETAHSKGIRVLLDYVPNHTSDEHEWFIASSDPTHENYTRYKDYYVWVDGTEDSVPNNWPGGFNEPSAWQWVEARQQYYLHQFHYKQPDLNYRNPVVLEEMKNVLRFWLDKGVDGFRMDAVICLVEAEGFPNITNGEPNPMVHQPETYAVVEEFRTVLDEYEEKVMVTEAGGTLDEVLGYYGNATNPGAHLSFNFLLITDLNGRSTAEEYVRVVSEWNDIVNERGIWSNWVLGNHDQHRVANRYSPELVDGMNMLVTLLPGTAVTYNGEEIGMEDNYNMTCEVAQDPQGCADNVTLGNSRDPERTPFQWDDSKNAGFSTADETWLPVNPNYLTLNAARQESAAGRSHLKTYRLLAQLRRDDEAIHNRNVSVTSAGSVFLFSRSQNGTATTVVALNVGSEEETVDIIESMPDGGLPTILRVYASSVNSELHEGRLVNARALRLPSQQAVVLRPAFEGLAGL